CARSYYSNYPFAYW
nr:immunoglobulin heavy chain junction region [Mus musculus]MBK4186739.1 immunoglobulin heavy chain junction region [Mus musculus]MBK4186740.1 immunoglobulin heavy chain junction region [Mus musculus]